MNDADGDGDAVGIFNIRMTLEPLGGRHYLYKTTARSETS